jgi:general stress protein CsbA
MYMFILYEEIAEKKYVLVNIQALLLIHQISLGKRRERWVVMISTCSFLLC